MKGGGNVAVTAVAKKRWRGLVIGVLGLVVLSMLVPLIFLLGLSNGFHSSGYVPEVQSAAPSRLRTFGTYGSSNSSNLFERNYSSHIDGILRKLGPVIPKDVLGNSTKRNENETIRKRSVQKDHIKKESSMPPVIVPQPLPGANNARKVGKVEHPQSVKGGFDDARKSCELKFGIYCLWRHEQREDMNDSMIKRLKDQLFVARAYYPSVAKIPAQDKLTREFKQNIQEFERVLGEASTDADLPLWIEKKVEKMETAIARAKSIILDCNNVDRKLRQILDLTEDEANFHMKQSAFLYQIAVQTMPKSLHCLSLRLTLEYFKSSLHDKELSVADKHGNPTLHHYVIFSTNILASSVVINSTVMHAKKSGDQVFHLLTDGENYFAMKFWFLRNTYKNATVQVLNIEHLNLDLQDKASVLYPFLPQEYLVSFNSIDQTSKNYIQTQYVSTFSHLHFLLPKIFQNLSKVVVMDDDVVVQQDLSALWSLNMRGKVNGAVQFCSVTLGQMKSYLGESSFNENTCAWMSGLNIIDLERWRELDLTTTYRRLAEEESIGRGSTEAGSLRASLLTFQDQIYALDDVWNLSGLGHDFGLDIQAIKKAAVLHYNGKMKPWLDLGIPRYRDYWKKFLNREDQFLNECNINLK